MQDPLAHVPTGKKTIGNLPHVYFLLGESSIQTAYSDFIFWRKSDRHIKNIQKVWIKVETKTKSKLFC